MYLDQTAPVAKRHQTPPPSILAPPRTALGRRLVRQFRLSGPVADVVAHLAGFREAR